MSVSMNEAQVEQWMLGMRNVVVVAGFAASATAFDGIGILFLLISDLML